MRVVAAVACVVAILATLAATAVAQSQRFPDVPADHYAFEAIEWAASAGVTVGYGDGAFKPALALGRWHALVFMERYYDEILGADESDDFTRADMMVLLKAINDGTLRDTDTGEGSEAGSSGAGSGQRFPDVPADHYAFEAIEWAASAGVTVGYGDGAFKPALALGRWHALVFMERYYDEILGADESDDFTRADMMVLLKAINDGTHQATGETVMLAPGACGGSSDDEATQWMTSNWVLEVAWSPDCARIVFSYSGDLWMMSNAGTAHHLVATGTTLGAPTWSPDGTRLAYTRLASSHKTHIWTMAVDGSEAEHLTEGLEPAWSPDGAMIAFAREVDTPIYDRHIAVMHSDGSGQRALTAGGRNEGAPAWSPDGSRLAYVRQISLGYESELIVADADGSNARAYVGNVDWRGGVSWSPDGSSVAFVRTTDTGSALYVSTLDGTGERVIADSHGQILRPQWSPDGQRIAFINLLDDTEWDLLYASALYVSGIEATSSIEVERPKTIPSAGTTPVGEPPGELGLDPFYTKHIDAGLPVVGSSEVSDEALRRVGLVLEQMTANRPDIIPVLAQNRVRAVVYAVTESMVDLPEVTQSMLDNTGFGPLVAGLGPSDGFPVVVLQEANLLCWPLPTSSVAVHEFGHAVDYALKLLGDHDFQRRHDAAYASAMAAGLWEGTYGATNAAEYWAEGVQRFMNVEKEGFRTWVNTRDELQYYDPVLYELILDVLGDVEATASCHGKQ